MWLMRVKPTRLLLPALVALCVQGGSDSLLLPALASLGGVLLSQTPVQAQNAEDIAKVAQDITVRIEGATQGSGVLVKRDGNRYTVLTAWHVVSGQHQGEELDIFTPDGQRHQLEQGSVKRLGEVDLAVLSFTSPTSYEVARVGDVKSVSSGSNIYVSGFPLPTSAVPTRIFRFLKGDVIANASVAIPNGYQLLYSNPTLPGMSGGAVMNAQGQLVGIHGQGETDSKMSEQDGVSVKTGTNQAVPIGYYSHNLSGGAVASSSVQASSADDYLAQARALLGKKGREQEVISLANQALATQQSSTAYLYRAFANDDLGHQKAAILDLDQAIVIDPRNYQAYSNRAKARLDLGDNPGAITDLDMALSLEPRYATEPQYSVSYYSKRAVARSETGDDQGAISDMVSWLIAVNPKNASESRKTLVEAGGLDAARGAARLLRQGNPRDAARFARLASILIPADPRVWELLAEAQLRSGQDTQASISLAKARTLDPGNAAVVFAQGSLAIRGGRPQEAINLIRQGLQMGGKDPGAFFDLGNSYLLTNRPSDALNAFERAAELKPDFWEAINNQALVLFEGNKKVEAIRLWRRAISIKSAAEPMMAMAAALNSTSPGNKESIRLAEQALKAEPHYAFESTLRENMWGERLRTAAMRLLGDAELKTIVNQAISRFQSSKGK